MKKLFLILLLTLSVKAQSPGNPTLTGAVASSPGGVTISQILDSSRYVDWSGAGFSIPNYTVACSTQPTLIAGSGNASTNGSSLAASIASCDATHNVVNIPAGTWYYTLISVRKGKVVIRGAGPNSTMLIPTVGQSCNGGLNAGICVMDPNPVNNQSAEILPPSGVQQCMWTGGYAQGTTSITLNSCGGSPPTVGQLMTLDQQNDTSDTSGVYICDDTTVNCTLESPGDWDGRNIGGITYSQQQVVRVMSVSGSGPYTVGISKGVYFTNVRSGQTPGAWFYPVTTTNVGVENLSIDGTTMSSGSPTNFGNIGFYQCYQCWIQNVRTMNAGRFHFAVDLVYQMVIKNNYLYGDIGGGSQSYGFEIESAVSESLFENNIFQQTTGPIIPNGSATGNVFDYNFALDDDYSAGGGGFTGASYSSHEAANNFNLWEGNNFVVGPWADDVHGSTTQFTVFRSMSPGWYAGKTDGTTPYIARARVRGMNIIGSIWGQPGYHTLYESYATSNSGGVNGGGSENASIYSFGWVTTGICTAGDLTNQCDALSRSTAMRWGNYDTVNAAVRWNSTEAAPAAVTYLNANFSTSYFNTLAHTLPASLYYSSTPSWWPSGKAWPPIGPDITSGNVGICTGTYAGAQATNAGQCSGGTLSSAWASHVTSIPAQDCYFSLGGPPDGTGSALAFDANTCYFPTAVVSFSEGSNGAASNGNFPSRNLYTNCATSCTGGTTPAPSPAGQRWCNSSQVVSCGSFGSNFVSTSISGFGTHALDNGLGAGGTDSAASMSFSSGGVSANGCPVGTNIPSPINGLTLIGNIPNTAGIHSIITQSSNGNTSYLAPTKITALADAANYYVRETCQKVNTITVGGEHLEWDLGHHLSGNDLFDFGTDFNFVTSKMRYAAHSSSWADMKIVESNGTTHTTLPWTANHWIYTLLYYFRTPTCSDTSGSNCMFWTNMCFEDFTAGTPMFCGALVDVASGLTPGGIPVSLPSWTRNQLIAQHQWDVNATSSTLTVNVDFDNIIAYHF